MEKRGSKSKEINYQGVKIFEYLLHNDKLIRKNMNDIPANTAKCIRKQSENNQHLYICDDLNEEEPEEEYQKIFGANLKEIKYVLNRFEENLKKKQEFEHAITNCQPPPSEGTYVVNF